MTPFFITGLPRSGTAWLANLFTTNKSICYHEPVLRQGNALGDGIDRLVARNAGRRVGISDSTLLRRFEQTREEFPDARWLLVVRDGREVIASMKALTPGIDESVIRCQIGGDLARLARMMTQGCCATLDFRALKDADVLKQAWRWLLPEVKFDDERFQILRWLNVQQEFWDVKRYRDELATPSAEADIKLVEHQAAMEGQV